MSAESSAARVIVTGSSSGIGAAIAHRLLAEGLEVHGLDVADASIHHVRFIAHRVDLADGESARAAAGTVLDDGPVQGLAHAAGLLRTAPLGRLSAGDGEAMWRVHVDAATRLADVVLPAMVRAGHGRVVLIGSRVWPGMPGRSQYAATKAALVSLARSWAAEVATAGVTVNTISPAATATPMLADPARASSTPVLPPIGRLIRPEEIAALVAFLFGPDAAAITGQDIAVCGGSSLPLSSLTR